MKVAYVGSGMVPDACRGDRRVALTGPLKLVSPGSCRNRAERFACLHHADHSVLHKARMVVPSSRMD